MEKRIITISREFGSGGRSIAKRVAETLNIPYYDKELVKQIAVETGLSEKYVEERGESAPVKSLLAYFLSSPRGANSDDSTGYLSVSDLLWCIQYKVISDLAEQGPCVILGRCSDYILRDRADCLHVFIHAKTPYKAERIVRLYGTSEQYSPEKRMQNKDKKRQVYYKRHTGRDWGMSQNYHLSLNSGYLGEDFCVDTIVNVFKMS
jgi:cytidylate kinase